MVTASVRGMRSSHEIATTTEEDNGHSTLCGVVQHKVFRHRLGKRAAPEVSRVGLSKNFRRATLAASSACIDAEWWTGNFLAHTDSGL